MRGYQLRIQVQDTPNPNALKFILNRDVKASGKVSFSDTAECANVPLAREMLSIPGVTQVHLFENVLTVTQDSQWEWEDLKERVREVLYETMEAHDVNFLAEKDVSASREHLPPDIRRIEEILDGTIRPGLQMDGGDVQVLRLDGKLLTIHYEGACGTCPSATMGTLNAIENILKDEFDPEIQVEAV